MAPASVTMTLRRVVQVEQHVDRDLPEDERIVAVPFGLRRIVRQQVCFDVALDETGAEKLLPGTQQRDCAGHVQLHSEGWRSEDESTNRRRVVVHPRRGDHAADAVTDDDDVFHADRVSGPDMGDEVVGVFYERRHAVGCPALARRSAMSPRVPRKNRHIVERQRVYDVLPAPAVFVSSVKQDQGFARRLFSRAGCREPRPVQEFSAVPRRQLFFDACSRRSHRSAPALFASRAARMRRSRMTMVCTQPATIRRQVISRIVRGPAGMWSQPNCRATSAQRPT